MIIAIGVRTRREWLEDEKGLLEDSLRGNVSGHVRGDVRVEIGKS